ncbi:unnamed protein product [Adineta steineri]|uniref:Domain of unknown function with conserved HDNR motif domain-containing protein n=1 Tax=Adineta steineri TaxID=433720 RepID=A0A818W583_9BILA|nr:unnamed protein product [Adineta steineri]CAF3720443.1 unnamed protein product [Adineta steineri]
MNQVQVRQVPLTTSSDKQRIVGTWFPTSYYGNFRAKSRADLADYFRQLAQPAPPKKFIDRQTAEANTHIFSQHDNRFKFECDPLVRNTQSGFGKRKAQSNARGEFNPQLISWMPKTTDRKTPVDDVKTTSYDDDYNRESTPSRILSEFQSNENDKEQNARPSSPTSVYSFSYQHGQPNYERSKQIRHETYQRFLSSHAQLSKQKSNGRSGSVASCMVWNNITNNDNKPSIPKEKIIDTVVPIKLERHSLIDNNNNNITSRQRVQSAGPRVIFQTPNELLQKPVQSQPMQIFKATIISKERPHTVTTTSREHYKGASFGSKITIPRPATPYEQTYTNRMQNLISKYM